MMFQTRHSIRIAGVAAVTVGALLLAGCAASSGGGSSSGGSGSKNYTITFLPKNLGNAYFDTSDKGGEKAIGEFKGKYAEVGPAASAPDAQVSYINTLTQQQVGAIVLSADDQKAPCSAINQAQKAGVKVVTFDSDTASGCRDLFINQATADGIAKVEVEASVGVPVPREVLG
jgi:rhamnose transport system substrate-binding protein